MIPCNIFSRISNTSLSASDGKIMPTEEPKRAVFSTVSLLLF